MSDLDCPEGPVCALELTANEDALLSHILHHYAGQDGLGHDNNWPLESLYEQHIPRPPEDDDDAHLRRVDVCRAITVAAVSKRCLTRDAAVSEMSDAWSMDNAPERRVPAAEWLKAFDVLGYIADDKSPQDPPAGECELWRGCTWENRFGLAWTEDQSVAQDFANRLIECGLPGVVVRTVVDAKERVKARFNTRDELEWVVDTRGLAVEVVVEVPKP